MIRDRNESIKTNKISANILEKPDMIEKNTKKCNDRSEIDTKA